MRILIALLLTLAGLVAATPSASAVAICSTQADPTDLVVGDDPIVRESCTTENIISYDCDLVVAVNYDGTVTRTLRCEPLIQCVTEPCPGPVGTSTAMAAPCQTVGNPFLDAGFGVQCMAAGAECHAAVATFGTIEDFLSPNVGCSTDLWPPYDCVQDCDGPPEASAAPSPCLVTYDPGAPDLSATCTVSFCEVGPVIDGGKYDHAVSCWSPLVCVTEPCPGSGRIEI